MKITDARVIVTCPGRNFVTLKIETDQGLTGLGDATLNGRELAVASYLNDHVIPCLIGRDAHRIEDTWQYLYRGAYWRRGPVTMSAIAAVDTALWDLKAKAAGLPLYQLLADRYAARTGRDLSKLDFYIGFNRWKSACIVHGVYSRYMEGKKSTEGVDMAGLKRGILQSLAQAEAAVERLEKRKA